MRSSMPPCPARLRRATCSTLASTPSGQTGNVSRARRVPARCEHGLEAIVGSAVVEGRHPEGAPCLVGLIVWTVQCDSSAQIMRAAGTRRDTDAFNGSIGSRPVE